MKIDQSLRNNKDKLLFPRLYWQENPLELPIATYRPDPMKKQIKKTQTNNKRGKTRDNKTIFFSAGGNSQENFRTSVGDVSA
jgi:hypothetical protein